MCCQATRRRRMHDPARNSRTSVAFLSNCRQAGSDADFGRISLETVHFVGSLPVFRVARVLEPVCCFGA